MTEPTTLADLDALATASRKLILDLQDPSGAYPASPTFSVYRGYSWLRDGAFIADGMSAAGEVESAQAFFDWCARMLESRADQVERIVAAEASGHPLPDAEMMPTRFTLDGRDGDDEWWDFQLDGYGLWLWAAAAHARRHGVDPSRWQRAFELTVDYLVSSWQRPCYDWWEEHVEQVHLSTIGSIAAGLRDAAALGVLDDARLSSALVTATAALRFLQQHGVADGHLVKWVGSTAVDASLASVLAPLSVVDASSPLGLATLKEIDGQLAVGGGVHRYLEDTYYGGGQWPLLSCMLGLAWADAGRVDRARELLVWSASTSRATGTLPEQVDEHLLAPDHEREWVDRWGPSADPLLWSAAMFLRLWVQLGGTLGDAS